MAEELTPEIRASLEALRERARSGEMTPEEIKRASELVSRIAGPVSMELSSERPRTIGELTGGLLSRNTFMAAGGVGGATLAGGATLPTGPGALAAAGAGGALGAAGMSAAFDNTNDVLRFLNILATPPDAKAGFERAGEIAVNAAKAGLEDATFAAGGMVVGETISRVGKPLVGFLLGLGSKAAQRIMRLAEAQGISISGTTAAQGMIGRGARAFSSIAGVFPFMGPVREGIREQFTSVNQRVRVLMDNFGPNAIMRDQLGIDMVAAVRGARVEFVRTASELYGRARQLSAAAGHPKIIPTANIRALGNEAIAAREAGELLDAQGKAIPPIVDDKINDFLSGLGNLEETISFAQFETISNQMRDLVGVLSKEGFDISRIAQLREAMETSIRSIDLGPSSQFDAFDPRQAIVDAMRSADEFYSKHIGEFQTPTAQRFARVDRNIMRPGAVVPGTINADEAADIVVNLRSAEAVQDLRVLAGDEVMDGAARSFLEDAWESSLKEGVPNADLFRQNLGLAGPQRTRVRETALREFLGEETVGNLKSIAEVLDNIDQIPNVNKFILRRTVLGGTRSLIGAATLVGGAKLFGSAGVGKTLLIAYAARRTGAMLNDPAQLRALTRVLGDQNATEAQMRGLLGRLMAANGDFLSIDLTGPADAISLTMKEALENPQVKFMIDFVSREESREVPEGIAGPR